MLIIVFGRAKIFFILKIEKTLDLWKSAQSGHFSDIFLLSVALLGVLQLILGVTNDYISFGLSRIIAYWKVLLQGKPLFFKSEEFFKTLKKSADNELFDACFCHTNTQLFELRMDYSALGWFCSCDKRI